jgi:Fibrinogen beta and gamma chains, C-terminal globular domain
VTVTPLAYVNPWIFIQNKVLNGIVLFSGKVWTDFRNGFGNVTLADNYWLGNEVINRLTASATFTLRVEVRQWNSIIRCYVA